VNPPAVHQRSAGLQVLDVREADERQPGGSAARGASRCCSFPRRLAELDRDRPVVVVYQSGNRSGTVVDDLTRAGPSAHYMDGGKPRSAREGRPRRLTVRCPPSLDRNHGRRKPTAAEVLAPLPCAPMSGVSTPGARPPAPR
jgi:rhodanese-related sulfurtransferase